jgi:hypothetical protein
MILLGSYEKYRRLKKEAFMKNSKRHDFLPQQQRISIISDEQQGNATNSTLAPENSMRMNGYSRDIFGMVAFGNFIVLSIFWLCLLIVFIADYYQLFQFLNFQNREMILHNQENLSIAFIIVWHIVTIWFLAIKINSTVMQTYFLADSTLENADYVLIEKQLKEEIVSSELSLFEKYVLNFQKYVLLER